MRELKLEGTRVTNASILQLGQFESLEILNLFGTSIDDSVVETLGALANLRYLEIYHTDISPQGIKHLEKALPNCFIRHADNLGERGTPLP
jgi:hypothetical protein